jgi:DNA-binding transcriptional MerR regulator/methylmalonyl-CoA mutase cobalamin-binding subunit
MEYGQPIRIVAKRTGMSPHLIRMWEKRYNAVIPKRTNTGRRFYSNEDIERLILLRRATKGGQAISQIAKLTLEQLKELFPENDITADMAIVNKANVSVEHYLNLSLQAMKNMDAVGLETQLLRASANLGPSILIEKLLNPLLELTGEMWADGRFNVAHEHLASAVIRSLLGSMHTPDSPYSKSPLLIGTTPQGQLHEFGALMALVSAATIGWNTLYLGPNLPAEDIAEAAVDRNAQAIALSIVYPADDPYLTAELQKIIDLTNGRTPILIGGRSAKSCGKILNNIKAIIITDLEDLKNKLESIRKTLEK